MQPEPQPCPLDPTGTGLWDWGGDPFIRLPVLPNLPKGRGVPGEGKLTREGRLPGGVVCEQGPDGKTLQPRVQLQQALFATWMFVDSQKVRVTNGL